jgi:hypothetical protein
MRHAHHGEWLNSTVALMRKTELVPVKNAPTGDTRNNHETAVEGLMNMPLWIRCTRTFAMATAKDWGSVVLGPLRNAQHIGQSTVGRGCCA